MNTNFFEQVLLLLIDIINMSMNAASSLLLIELGRKEGVVTRSVLIVPIAVVVVVVLVYA